MLGAVLAGGASARMGEPKAELRIGGVTFLEAIIRTLATVVDEVVVCGGDSAPPGIPLIADPHPGLGPVGGIVSAFEVSGGRPLVIVPVDVPLIDERTLRVVASPSPVAGQMRMARVSGRPQPLVAAIALDLAPYATAVLGGTDRSAMALVRSVPIASFIDVDPSVLVNINDRGDLDRLRSDR